MRGLTPEERWFLEPERVPCDQDLFDRLAPALVAQGRLLITLAGCDSVNTEMGDLALRVCPVDES